MVISPIFEKKLSGGIMGFYGGTSCPTGVPITQIFGMLLAIRDVSFAYARARCFIKKITGRRQRSRCGQRAALAIEGTSLLGRLGS